MTLKNVFMFAAHQYTMDFLLYLAGVLGTDSRGWYQCFLCRFLKIIRQHASRSNSLCDYVGDLGDLPKHENKGGGSVYSPSKMSKIKYKREQLLNHLNKVTATAWGH